MRRLVAILLALLLPSSAFAAGTITYQGGSGTVQEQVNRVIANTAPSLTLTDTTASAKSLTIAVDANLAQLRESAGASGSLVVLDLANNRVGIGKTPTVEFDLLGGFNTVFTGANPAGVRANFYNLDLSGTASSFSIGTDSWVNSTTAFVGTSQTIYNFEIVNRMGASGGGGTPGTLNNSTLLVLSDHVFNGYTITNSYGLYIASLAGTTKWGIYDASGGNWYNATGKLGLGTAPTTLLDLLGADNTTATTIKINATQANVTAADTFLDFRSTTGSEGSIAGTAVAGVIAYNTFTGSHYTQVEDADRASLQVGMLLEATGDAMTPTGKKTRTRTIPEKRHVDEKDGKETITPAQDIEETFEASHKPYLVKSRIARTKGSKAAYGVYGGTDKEGRDLVLALGTGLCYVTKTAKAIAVGDYLMASDVAGMMEVQADDVYRNSTVAKAMTNVAWAVGETSKQIPCIYLGG